MFNIDDERIEQALSLNCMVCGAPAGEECVTPDTRRPLLEAIGTPVHTRRLDF